MITKEQCLNLKVKLSQNKRKEKKRRLPNRLNNSWHVLVVFFWLQLLFLYQFCLHAQDKKAKRNEKESSKVGNTHL